LEGDVAILRIFLDLTDRKKAEEQLRQAQKIEAVGQLTGGVAHEFNNLLMVIVGNLEMAMDHNSDARVDEFASLAMKGAMCGAELTQQLLTFSRKQNLKIEQLELNSLVRGTRGMLQRMLGETVSVEIALAENVWPVVADPGLVESALLNLLLNARDAMPQGGKITITTSNRSMDARQLSEHPDVAAGDYVMLEVSDGGVGMSPDILAHVFEPFFATKEVGEGTGLGLSMILGFVDQSAGFVDIESTLGSGTQVRLFLPRAQEQTRTFHQHEISPDGLANVEITVLVVEDDAGVRDLVVHLLSQLGCAVIEAEDGGSALARLRDDPGIDVLFTDVVLPGGMSGPDIAEAARELRPGLKVVFSSGYPDGEVNELGPDGERPWFIRKPYRRSELAEILQRAMNS